MILLLLLLTSVNASDLCCLSDYSTVKLPTAHCLLAGGLTKIFCPSKKVIPILESEQVNDTQCNLIFGFNNPGPFDVLDVSGIHNRFSPAPSDRGQPTSFAKGITHNKYTLIKDCNEAVNWTIYGHTLLLYREVNVTQTTLISTYDDEDEAMVNNNTTTNNIYINMNNDISINNTILVQINNTIAILNSIKNDITVNNTNNIFLHINNSIAILNTIKNEIIINNTIHNDVLNTINIILNNTNSVYNDILVKMNNTITLINNILVNNTNNVFVHNSITPFNNIMVNNTVDVTNNNYINNTNINNILLKINNTIVILTDIRNDIVMNNTYINDILVHINNTISVLNKIRNDIIVNNTVNIAPTITNVVVNVIMQDRSIDNPIRQNISRDGYSKMGYMIIGGKVYLRLIGQIGMISMGSDIRCGYPNGKWVKHGDLYILNMEETSYHKCDNVLIIDGRIVSLPIVYFEDKRIEAEIEEDIFSITTQWPLSLIQAENYDIKIIEDCDLYATKCIRRWKILSLCGGMNPLVLRLKTSCIQNVDCNDGDVIDFFIYYDHSCIIRKTGYETEYKVIGQELSSKVYSILPFIFRQITVNGKLLYSKGKTGIGDSMGLMILNDTFTCIVREKVMEIEMEIGVKFLGRFFPKKIRIDQVSYDIKGSQTYYYMLPFAGMYMVYAVFLLRSYKRSRQHALFFCTSLFLIIKFTFTITYATGPATLYTVLRQTSHFVFTLVLTTMIRIWESDNRIKTLWLSALYVLALVVINALWFLDFYIAVLECAVHMVLVLTLLVLTIIKIIYSEKKVLFAVVIFMLTMALAVLSFYIVAYIILSFLAPLYTPIAYVGIYLAEFIILTIITLCL